MRLAAISTLILGLGLTSALLSLSQPPLGPADPAWKHSSSMPRIDSFPIPADLPQGRADAL